MADYMYYGTDWLGGRAYPRRRLNDAWALIMGGQFHDIIPGTSIPKAYEYAWNDEVLALNQFGCVLTGAVETVAAALDTRVRGSAVIVQTVRLAAGGAGGRVEFATVVDWMTPASHLKAIFPLTARNTVAAYNWDIGTIERPTDNENQFEMPSHQWVDLTDASGAFGATILTGPKIGSDKPDDHTIRLILVRTPGIEGGRGYTDQASQDWGRHEIVYGIAGPARLERGALVADFGPSDGPNAMTAQGQTLTLPSGKNGRVYILAASASGDQKAVFKIGDKAVELTVQEWGGYVGQWDNRIWTTRQETVSSARTGMPRVRAIQEYAGLVQGFIKLAPIAWFSSHRHLQDGTNDPYAYSYLFAHMIEVPPGATTLTLPDNDRIRILAVTVSDEGVAVRPAHPLFDTLQR